MVLEYTSFNRIRDKYKSMLNRWLHLVCILSSSCVLGQVVNQGSLYILPHTELSTYFSFENLHTAQTFNNGVFVLHQDFINHGLYDYLNEGKEFGKTVFTSTQMQQIKGAVIPKFYDVVFDNTHQGIAFEVSSGLIAQGTVDFNQGIVQLTSLDQSFVFEDGAEAQKMSNQSYVEGYVDKIGNTPFVFPIGDKGFYRNSTISGPKNKKDVIASRYVLADADFFTAHPQKAEAIEILNTQEYWELQGNKGTQSDIILSLEWNEDTTPLEILQTAEANLSILRWDVKEQAWVDEGGVVDMANKRVTTPTTIRDFGFFTLGTVKKDWMLGGDVVIYNLVTPNGDGKNDYFIIENIHRYPNNKVEIFNRWGTRVYEAKGYDPQGDGSTQVFRGYSAGKATLDRGSKLPSGTYYYIVTYEQVDEKGSRLIKKAANLHLENN